MKTRTQKRKPRQKVSRSLSGFAEARKSHVDLMADIQSHVVSQAAKSNTREDHKIHVSELVKSDFCPRRLFYKVTKADRTDVEPSAGHRMEMIWAAGNAEHAKWQRWLQEMGMLWGNWKCQVCGHVLEETEQPDGCPSCGYALWLYDEAHLEVPSSYLVGHSDGAVPDREVLVEVKSFSVGTVRIENPSLVKEHTHKVNGKTLVDQEGLWNAIKRPLPGHLKQGMFYLWMCKQMGLPYTRILFIYENKTTQATKAFDIKYSERMIREELAALEDVVVFAEEGVVPKRPALFDKNSKPCNACPFRTLCWENDDHDREETSEVSPRRPRTRSRATGGEAEVHAARATRDSDPSGPGRHHRTRRPRTAQDDDAADSVGRAPRRATRDGRGRRTLGRSRDGEG